MHRLFVLRERDNSLDYRQTLKLNDLVLRKRMSYSPGTNRKLSYRLVFDGYVIVKRVGTATYQVQSLLHGTKLILPASQLVRWANSKEALLELLAKMSVIAEREMESGNVGVTTRSRSKDE